MSIISEGNDLYRGNRLNERATLVETSGGHLGTRSQSGWTLWGTRRDALPGVALRGGVEYSRIAMGKSVYRHVANGPKDEYKETIFSEGTITKTKEKFFIKEPGWVTTQMAGYIAGAGETKDRFPLMENQKRSHWETHNRISGDLSDAFNISNTFAAGSQLMNEGLWNTYNKAYNYDKVKEYFKFSDPESVEGKTVDTASDKFEKEFYKMQGVVRSLKNDKKLTDVKLETKINGREGKPGSVTYMIKDDKGETQYETTIDVASLDKDAIKAASQMGVALRVIDDGLGGYESEKAFYRLMSNAAINASQMDAVMRLGFLTNDLSSADRSGIILNRVVNI